VIANYEEAQPVTVQAALDSGQILRRWRLVDDPRWYSVQDEITIPPSSAAVVLP
jgi:hypothetical protein